MSGFPELAKVVGVRRFTIPKFTWGAAFANTCELAFPFTNLSTTPKEADGSERISTYDYQTLGWSHGMVSRLAATVMHVPPVDEADIGMNVGVTVTGWEGVTGWRALLAYGHTCRDIRLYPNRALGDYWTVKLMSPWDGRDIAPAGGNYARVIPVVFQMADGVSYFDGY